jgi:hypothetical protein
MNRKFTLLIHCGVDFISSLHALLLILSYSFLFNNETFTIQGPSLLRYVLFAVVKCFVAYA